MTDFRTWDRIETPFSLKPYLYVLVGLPRSGRSTWANANHRRLDATIFCRDDVRRALGVRYEKRLERRVAEVSFLAAKALLLRGQNVILDEINLTIANRRQWLQLAQDGICRVQFVLFQTPDEDELKRRCEASEFPWDVILQMMAAFEPLHSSEFIGRDGVTYIQLR